MNIQSSPCLFCSRVPDPGACENKRCAEWRKWFLKRWETIRKYPRAVIDQSPTRPMGVPIGGRFYAHPHRVREHFAKSPCESCFAKGLCKAPCKILMNWKTEGGKQ